MKKYIIRIPVNEMKEFMEKLERLEKSDKTEVEAAEMAPDGTPGAIRRSIHVTGRYTNNNGDCKACWNRNKGVLEGLRMNSIKGYKAFDEDWKCRGFQYEVGKTYTTDEPLNLCGQGFHFCKKVADCFNYYPFDVKNKIAEIEASGIVLEEGDKCCTNIIKIVREISWVEMLELANVGLGCSGINNSGDYNSGSYNSGYGNSGDRNSGNCNSGNRNSGSYNSGYCNSGNRNSGDFNSGYGNSGNYNSGDRNSGNCNSGNRNSGSYNSGYGNSGYGNSGDRNSGNYNSGDCNSGNYNSGNYNSGDRNKASFSNGCFNTITPNIKLFNKESDLTLNEWRRTEACILLNTVKIAPTLWVNSANMTDEEKSEHPEYATTGGYLKFIDVSNSYVSWWKNLTLNEKQIIMDIPNFDPEIFKEITGIDVYKG